MQQQLDLINKLRASLRDTPVIMRINEINSILTQLETLIKQKPEPKPDIEKLVPEDLDFKSKSKTITKKSTSRKKTQE